MTYGLKKRARTCEYQILLQEENQKRKRFISIFTTSMRIIGIRQAINDIGIAKATGIPL